MIMIPPCPVASDKKACRFCYHKSSHEHDPSCKEHGSCPACALPEREQIPKSEPVKCVRVKKEASAELTVEENEQQLRMARLTHTYDKAKQARIVAKRKQDVANEKVRLSRKSSQK